MVNQPFPILLFDGKEEQLSHVSLPEYLDLGTALNIHLFQPIHAIKAIHHPDIINAWLAQEPRFKKGLFQDSYKGTDDLSVYFHWQADLKKIVLLSFGEFQPTRYKIWLEGVLEVKE